MMKKMNVKQFVPALPAVDLKETVAFYEKLGFVNTYAENQRRGGYAIMTNDYFEFHLYTYKKLTIPTPTNIYIYEIENIDEWHKMLETNYIESVGKKLSRTGLPRMGIPKNLNFDRRFTMTDPNGNYFIFVQPFEQKKEHQIKSRFEKLYWESNTLAYSHESPIEAKKMLEIAIARHDVLNEKSEIAFQTYVLLVDCSYLLGNKTEAEMYYKEATKYLEKVVHKDEYFEDAMV
ncbi:hypothetical protein RV16_GL001652 [Enterococcus saccharolyticus]|nr:hypothetical protein RV16_GL001652 [Enterococcus saccharolyticus]